MRTRSLPPTVANRAERDQFARRAAAVLWCTFALLVVATRLGTEPSFGNVFDIYRRAAFAWRAGAPLYADGTFPYLPAFAALFVPWSLLPFALGGALWRVASIALLALGVRAATTARFGPRSGRAFLIASCFSTALTWSAARHGQATLAMGGVLLLAFSTLARGRAGRGALQFALAVAIKPLALGFLPFALLLAPRAWLRVLGATTFVFALPFFVPLQSQPSGYAFGQYAALWQLLGERAVGADGGNHPQLLTVLRLVGIDLGRNGADVLRGLLVVAALALLARARWSEPSRVLPRELVVLAFTTGAAVVLLLNPVTERNTYALMAPALGLFAATAVVERSPKMFATMLLATLACLVSHALDHAFPDTLASMAKPFACLVLVGVVVQRALARPLAVRARGLDILGTRSDPAAQLPARKAI